MTKEKKKKVLDFLDLEIEKVKTSAAKTSDAAGFVMSGFSEAGDKQSLTLRDKYHAEKTAELTKQYLERLKALRKEIENSSVGVVNKAAPISYIKIRYEDGSELEFFLVENAASVTRFVFISKDSPLGKAVLGKKTGESFSYKLEDGMGKRSFSGKIVGLE